MPNWCMDRLTVTSSDPAALVDFAAAASGPGDHGTRIPLSFEAIVPGPGPERREPSRIRALPVEPDPSFGPNRAGVLVMSQIWGRDGGEWRMARWGTKWNLDDDILVEGSFLKGRLVYHFSTAWSPPIAFVVAASAMFPAVRFDLCFAESGNGFAGRVVLEAGAYVTDAAWSGLEAAAELKTLRWDAYEHFLPDEDEEAEADVP